MNRLFLFCAALLLQVVLFSCKEEVDTTDTAENAVGFSAGSVNDASRAAVLDLDGLKTSGFLVNAYSTGVDKWASVGSSTAPEFMYKQGVTWDGNKWTYDPVKFWPGKVNGSDYGKLSFFAWSDVGASVSGDNQTPGTPALTFTVPNAQSGQKDLVTGVAVDKIVTGGVVPFEFKHVLSRIGFTAKFKEANKGVPLTVTSLKVGYKSNAVKSKGVYTFGDTDGAAGGWALDGSTYMSHAGDQVVTTSVTLNEDGSSKQLNGADKYLMLLPQAVDYGDLVLDVSWEVGTADPKQELTQKVFLPAQTWEQGKCYDYNLIVSPVAVTFDGVTVEPWNETVLTLCELTYDSNNGTGEKVNKTLFTGREYTAAGNTFTPPTGYAFIGWNTEPNGSGDSYQPGDNITLDGAMTLYAQWDALVNCYTVIPGESKSFPVARAYVDDGLSDKLRVDAQNDYTGSFTAEVVWDDASVINGTPTVSGSGKSAVVTVQTNNVSGNAVVAVKKGSDIVWSYHIWVTGYDPAQDAGWNPSSNGGTTSRTTYKFMDRNLGATAAENSLAGRGLFYQWGRKDPFPPNDVSGFSAALGPVTLMQAIRNPGTFYYITSGNDFDWLASARDNTLWGGDGEGKPKSIYDPCPAGWRVPLSGADALSPWSGYTTGKTYTTGEAGGYELGSPVQTYWPAAGCRAFTTGALFNSGEDGSYWSATVTGASAYNLGFSSGFIHPSYTFNRSQGLSVRCVAE